MAHAEPSQSRLSCAKLPPEPRAASSPQPQPVGPDLTQEGLGWHRIAERDTQHCTTPPSAPPHREVGVITPPLGRWECTLLLGRGVAANVWGLGLELMLSPHPRITLDSSHSRGASLLSFPRKEGTVHQGQGPGDAWGPWAVVQQGVSMGSQDGGRVLAPEPAGFPGAHTMRCLGSSWGAGNPGLTSPSTSANLSTAVHTCPGPAPPLSGSQTASPIGEQE